ncbi:MAG TPA: Arm DNA-binding domain-containing protein [Jiangellaceae bacterium]
MLDLDRDGTGRRRQKWHSGFRTKREAEKGLTALLAAQDTGTYVAPQKITLGEYLAERWLPAIECGRRRSPGYRAHVRV